MSRRTRVSVSVLLGHWAEMYRRNTDEQSGSHQRRADTNMGVTEGRKS